MRTGRLTGIGNIAGRPIAWVRWDDDDRPEPFTLREFQKHFGRSARRVGPNDILEDKPITD